MKLKMTLMFLLEQVDLGGGEFSTRSRFGENLGAIPVGGGRICKFGLEIQI